MYWNVSCSALKFYRKTDDVYNDMEEMDTEHHHQAAGTKQSFTLKQLVTSADLRRPLYIACMLQLAQQFSGINAVSIIIIWEEIIYNI